MGKKDVTGKAVTMGSWLRAISSDKGHPFCSRIGRVEEGLVWTRGKEKSRDMGPRRRERLGYRDF